MASLFHETGRGIRKLAAVLFMTTPIAAAAGGRRVGGRR
jgi:hypothetical protein